MHALATRMDAIFHFACEGYRDMPPQSQIMQIRDTSIPPETLEGFFAFLSAKDLIRAMQVNKNWRAVIIRPKGKLRKRIELYWQRHIELPLKIDREMDKLFPQKCRATAPITEEFNTRHSHYFPELSPGLHERHPKNGLSLLPEFEKKCSAILIARLKPTQWVLCLRMVMEQNTETTSAVVLFYDPLYKGEGFAGKTNWMCKSFPNIWDDVCERDSTAFFLQKIEGETTNWLYKLLNGERCKHPLMSGAATHPCLDEAVGITSSFFRLWIPEKSSQAQGVPSK